MLKDVVSVIYLFVYLAICVSVYHLSCHVSEVTVAVLLSVLSQTQYTYKHS